MSRLATLRDRGHLICRCRYPDPRTVILFGYWELADVYECARCWKPILCQEWP